MAPNEVEMWAELLSECCTDRTVIIIAPTHEATETPEEETQEHAFDPFEDYGTSHTGGGGGSDMGSILMGNPNQ